MPAIYVTLSAVSFVGLIGNLYLLRNCSRSPKQRKKHTFFLNQAFIGAAGALCVQTSCFVVVFGTPLTGYANSAHRFLSSWLAIASVYQLAAMSIKRCLMVWRPFLERKVQLWHKMFGIAIVYFLSATITASLAVESTQATSTPLIRSSAYPVIAYTVPQPQLAFYMIAWLLAPFFIMILCYGIILHVVIRTANQDRQRKVSNSRRQIYARVKGKKRRMLRRVCVSMMTVLGTFVCLWAPYTMVKVGWPLLRHDTPPADLMMALGVLAQTFVIYNPFLCGLEGYRAVLRSRAESMSLPTSYAPTNRQLRIACNQLRLSPSVTVSVRGPRSSDRSTVDV